MHDPITGHTSAPSPARIQTSVLSSLERRVLVWMAHRLPHWIHSDHLTLLALVAMIGVGVSYALSSAWPPALLLTIVFLAINWFGDSLDGTVARVRNHQRPRYGYYVDHVVDALGLLFVCGGLALSGFMSPAITAILLVAYLLVCLEVYLAAAVVRRFQMTFFGMGPTELRIVLSMGSVALYMNPHAAALGGTLLLFDAGGLVATAGLLGVFVYSAVRNTRHLYREEPRPRHIAATGPDVPPVSSTRPAPQVVPGVDAAVVDQGRP
jgi:archaetidylinositol phosphate synthase